MKKEMDLRYGENPHQRAALYGSFNDAFEKLHGKELSYNNILDISAAASLITEFDEPTVAIIKHTNPCGVGSADTLADAYGKAFATDKASAFGGIVAVNRPLDMEAAQRINEVSRALVQVPQGSLYPALHRLENRGFLSAEWKQTESGREARVYRLTKKGRAHLDEEIADWRRLSEAIGLVLQSDLA
jgi:phosphoribosylaminoimidazolecarboxamide formyltransferase/IMP cyclohydrolase